MKNKGGGATTITGGDTIITFHEDYTERSKVAQSDNQFAYKQFAKMNIPKHVENFIKDEEEFGDDSSAAISTTIQTIQADRKSQP